MAIPNAPHFSLILLGAFAVGFFIGSVLTALWLGLNLIHIDDGSLRSLRTWGLVFPRSRFSGTSAVSSRLRQRRSASCRSA